MSEPVSINAQIVEGLYCEALVLSDEVRDSFALNGRIDDIGQSEDLTRVALSCEGLRTTTRMMHAIAWLLNHRAFFTGELSEFQLRRHGKLSPDLYGGNSGNLEMLPTYLQRLVGETDRFYARLLRLDREWCRTHLNAPGAIARLRDRVASRAEL